MKSARWWCGLAMALAPAFVLGADAEPAQCVPRESFPGFIVHFRQDAEFRAARIQFPLPVENGAAFQGCWTLTRVELGGS